MTAPDPLAYDPGYGPLVQTRVRIATWNLWGRYGPWEARLPVIVENLSAINADIIALQEVWEDDTRSQARELAAALGCSEPVYAANLERDGFRSGNAILSRWPIARHEVRAKDLDRPARARDFSEHAQPLFALFVDGVVGAAARQVAHFVTGDRPAGQHRLSLIHI